MRALAVYEICEVTGGNKFLYEVAKWLAGNLTWEALKASSDWDAAAFGEYIDNVNGGNMK